MLGLEVAVVLALDREDGAEEREDAVHHRRQQRVRELGTAGRVGPRALVGPDKSLPEPAHEDPFRRDQAEDRLRGDPVGLAVEEHRALAHLRSNFGDVHRRFSSANHYHLLSLNEVLGKELGGVDDRTREGLFAWKRRHVGSLGVEPVRHYRKVERVRGFFPVLVLDHEIPATLPIGARRHAADFRVESDHGAEVVLVDKAQDVLLDLRR
mmetsp:Transcript_25142/g.59926  ORF Transcript_25142/g.59926 Transcript_25142/m.59926 type:complete len:210 (-) Transcript_25142:357-986(-)